MAAFLFSPLAPCKLLCLVLGRVRKKEQFLAAVMLVVSGSGRISKLTFYSRFSSLVSLTFPTRTSQCCSNESGNSSPHGRLNLQHSGSQLQGSISDYQPEGGKGACQTLRMGGNIENIFIFKKLTP